MAYNKILKKNFVISFAIIKILTMYIAFFIIHNFISMCSQSHIYYYTFTFSMYLMNFQLCIVVQPISELSELFLTPTHMGPLINFCIEYLRNQASKL